MHEKTLLYGALGATAIATIFGVARMHRGGSGGDALPDGMTELITPVTMIDSSDKMADASSPIQLTASDGSGIRLVAMSAKAVVDDPLALTELHLVFQNPENRV